jgi:DNA-binding HxlR family transcriptional regulator
VAIRGRKPLAKPVEPERSPCPVSCSLDLLGDRWTLLVVRDLMLGHTRFRDFAASPEGIPTNVLSDRLDRLRRHGVVEQLPVEDSPGRMGYRLTEKGQALRPMLEALRDWGLAWAPGARVLRGEVPKTASKKS